MGAFLAQHSLTNYFEWFIHFSQNSQLHSVPFLYSFRLWTWVMYVLASHMWLCPTPAVSMEVQHAWPALIHVAGLITWSLPSYKSLFGTTIMTWYTCIEFTVKERLMKPLTGTFLQFISLSNFPTEMCKHITKVQKRAQYRRKHELSCHGSLVVYVCISLLSHKENMLCPDVWRNVTHMNSNMLSALHTLFICSLPPRSSEWQIWRRGLWPLYPQFARLFRQIMYVRSMVTQ